MARRSGSGEPALIGALIGLWIMLTIWLWKYIVWFAVLVWRGTGWLWDARSPELVQLRRTSIVRDVLAVGCVIAASLIWRWGAIDVGQELNSSIGGRSESVLVILVAVILSSALFLALARRGHRLDMAALTAVPVVTALTVVAMVGVLLSLLPDGPVSQLLGRLDQAVGSLQASGNGWLLTVFVLWQFVKAAGGFAVIITGAVTFCALLVKASRSRFRARDAHPFLEPVIAIALALYALARGVFGGLAASDPAYPLIAAWLLTFAGPVVVIVLSVVQICLMRNREGVRFRQAPSRGPDRYWISARARRIYRWLGAPFAGIRRPRRMHTKAPSTPLPCRTADT